MRQPGELAQRIAASPARARPSASPSASAASALAALWLPDDAQLVHRQQLLAAGAQPFAAALCAQQVVGAASRARSEKRPACAGPDAAMAAHHRIIGVDHGRRRSDRRCAPSPPHRPHVGVAVQVVGRHVQHGGRRKLQRMRGLQLVAGELQHVQVRRDRLRADPAPAARGCRPRACDSPARRPCSATSVVTVLLPLVPVMPTTRRGIAAREQLDVTDDRHAAGCARRRRTDRPAASPGDATTKSTSASSATSRPPSAMRSPGATGAKLGESRRRGARIRDRHLPAAREQVADHRVTRLAQPRHDCAR